MTQKRIRLSDLIAAHILKPPFPIHARFKGKHFAATIDKDGFILLEGRRHTSLSIAGGFVRSSLSGKPADGLPYRRVNGWTFWKFTDTSGQWIPMHELRKQYAKTSRRRVRQVNGAITPRSR